MSYQKDIFSLIERLSGSQNMIAVPRLFCEMTGSLDAGVLLSQIIYWSDKGRDPEGWFYKSYLEWYDDVFLSEYQVRKHVKTFENLGLLETKLSKVQGSPTLHYRVNRQALSEWILKYLGIETANSSDGNPNISVPFHIYTENTSENTNREDKTTITTDRAEPGSRRRRQPPTLSSVAPTQTAQPTTTRNGTKPTERTRQNDPAYDAICTAIESNGFGYMTPVLAKQVKDAMAIHPQTAIEKAIEIAVGQNKRFWNYVTGILDNMQREGYNYDNGQFRRERSGNHRGHTAPESDADRRQREYNERYTCLVADEINRVITHEQAVAGWAALESEFAGYEYRDMPQVQQR